MKNQKSKNLDVEMRRKELLGVVRSIQLFSHNQIAYNSALEMLESCGKAAIIHPAGTGKSFIGFKLCEEKSEEKVCWLSPSEYIFRTQIENLKKAGGTEPSLLTVEKTAKKSTLKNNKGSWTSLEWFGKIVTAFC